MTVKASLVSLDIKHCSLQKDQIFLFAVCIRDMDREILVLQHHRVVLIESDKIDDKPVCEVVQIDR